MNNLINQRHLKVRFEIIPKRIMQDKIFDPIYIVNDKPVNLIHINASDTCNRNKFHDSYSFEITFFYITDLSQNLSKAFDKKQNA